MAHSSFEKYKHETIELDNKKRLFLTFALILLGVSVILYVFGFVTLVAAIEGQLHFTAADILLILASNALIGAIVLLIVRKAVFDKKLKEREALIRSEIKNRQNKKVHHIAEE